MQKQGQCKNNTQQSCELTTRDDLDLNETTNSLYEATSKQVPQTSVQITKSNVNCTATAVRGSTVNHTHISKGAKLLTARIRSKSK